MIVNWIEWKGLYWFVRRKLIILWEFCVCGRLIWVFVVNRIVFMLECGKIWYNLFVVDMVFGVKCRIVLL